MYKYLLVAVLASSVACQMDVDVELPDRGSSTGEPAGSSESTSGGSSSGVGSTGAGSGTTGADSESSGGSSGSSGGADEESSSGCTWDDISLSCMCDGELAQPNQCLDCAMAAGECICSGDSVPLGWCEDTPCEVSKGQCLCNDVPSPPFECVYLPTCIEVATDVWDCRGVEIPPEWMNGCFNFNGQCICGAGAPVDPEQCGPCVEYNGSCLCRGWESPAAWCVGEPADACTWVVPQQECECGGLAADNNDCWDACTIDEVTEDCVCNGGVVPDDHCGPCALGNPPDPTSCMCAATGPAPESYCMP